MMSWNHRVIRTTEAGEHWYGVHEVFYDDDSDPRRPTGATAEAVRVSGEDLDEIRLTLDRMAAAAALPVLEWDGDNLVEVRS